LDDSEPEPQNKVLRGGKLPGVHIGRHGDGWSDQELMTNYFLIRVIR